MMEKPKCPNMSNISFMTIVVGCKWPIFGFIPGIVGSKFSLDLGSESCSLRSRVATIVCLVSLISWAKSLRLIISSRTMKLFYLGDDFFESIRIGYSYMGEDFTVEFDM